MARNDRLPAALLALTLAALVVSGIAPRERVTWVEEVAPYLIALPILLWTYRRFRLTNLLYVLVALHSVVLFVGGHYTYAEVPAGFWVQDALHLARNDYDRLGHFAQGFVPAIAAREVLVRLGVVKRGAWLPFLVACVCLAFSALYEIIEWRTAVMSANGATAFLGTQGDPWDTQWDMLTCLIGAVTALLLLSRWHDRQLAG